MGSEPRQTGEAGGGLAAQTPSGAGPAALGRAAEWAALGEWLESPPLLHKVDLESLRERLRFVGRARASLAAFEADLVAEVARREGEAAAEETLRGAQKRSRRGARKAVRTAARLEWAPDVAEKLAAGAITPEAADLILDAAAETSVDQRKMLAAAESEPEDLFRRTLKDHVNELISEQEIERRREAQRRRRRASISEKADGMFHLFAEFDPLTGARVQAALVAKADELFRTEDAKDRPTPPQRFADALAELVCDSTGAPAGAELIVLADYDVVREQITDARLADGTRLTEAETLAISCDAGILSGIFNKHTNEVALGRSQRKVPKWLRKQLIARDGGCIGCAAHHNICQVHHRRHWQHGGQTTLENTCLVCWRCHHVRIHRNGEEVTQRPDGRLTIAPPTDTPSGGGRAKRPPPHNQGGTRVQRARAAGPRESALPSRPHGADGMPAELPHQPHLAIPAPRRC